MEVPTERVVLCGDADTGPHTRCAANGSGGNAPVGDTGAQAERVVQSYYDAQPEADKLFTARGMLCSHDAIGTGLTPGGTRWHEWRERS